MKSDESPAGSAAQPRRTRLHVPLDEAMKQIDERIALGDEMLRRLPERGEPSLAQLEVDEQIWTENNIGLLRSLFSSDEIAREFAGRTPAVTRHEAGSGLRIRWEDEIRRVRMRQATLREIRTRLVQFVREPDLDPPAAPGSNRRVLLLPGGETSGLQGVITWLQSLGLEALLPAARTARATLPGPAWLDAAGFAIVLLGNPEDPGLQRFSEQLLQLGFLAGRLGADRVCALSRAPHGGLIGELFAIPLDGAGAWKHRLITRLRAAGLDFPAAAEPGAPGRS